MNMNIFDLNGKVALITGGNSGIGNGMAITLAKAHAKIAIIGKDIDKLSQAKTEIEGLGTECFALKADITNPAEVKVAVDTIIAHYSRIDILINNAGTSLVAPAENMENADYLNVINLNLNATYYMAKEVGKHMIVQKYGKIINIASINSEVSYINKDTIAYDASKGGVLMLTKSLASEWGKYGITVNAIGPGIFPSTLNNDVFNDQNLKAKTENNIPLKRLGRNGDLDGIVLYFASDASCYTTGQIMYVDGGITIV